MFRLKCLPLQVIIYVDDANDEPPVFTQQQYNRLGLSETAGIGTSVIVVSATDPDTGGCNLRLREKKGVKYKILSISFPQKYLSPPLVSNWTVPKYQ